MKYLEPICKEDVIVVCKYLRAALWKKEWVFALLKRGGLRLFDKS